MADADGLTADGVTAGYAGRPVVRGVSFAVGRGRFLSLLGPSGCGKTTLLNVLGGYHPADAGTVRVAGRDVTRLPPERRNVGTVFQSYALFPHLTARDNVGFGLAVRGLPRAEARRRADGWLDRVGLSADERDRRPHQLSGGQQQRVALARALAFGPDVLLLDEPLANLDRHLREQLRGELRRVQRDAGVTAVLVTHDAAEALAVSDLVGVMRAGRLVQAGPPAEVYGRPRTPFVAAFLGDANLLPGPRLGRPAGAVLLVRPEDVRVGPAADGCRWGWVGRVAEVTYHGADLRAAVRCDDGLSLTVRARPGELTEGVAVAVGVPDHAIWPVPDEDGEL